MKIFGLEVLPAKSFQQKMQAVYATGAGWFNIVRESFTGAWQSFVQVDAPKEILAFSAVFSCVTLIAGDIAKIGADLVQKLDDGVTTKVKDAKYSPFLRVLVRPNRYQTWLKFIEQWVVSKLLYGNAYILKQRETGMRGLVVALYVLDAQRITPLVAEDGSVYYQLSKDYLSGLKEPIVVPQSEIIHDTMVSLWHPLVGVSPIYACGTAATMGNRILANSTRFFGNSSRPGGQLTAPGKIDDETAKRLKREFEENFSGGNAGRLFVGGNGLKYEAMAVPAADAQLIEQLDWSVADVARCFHMPLWKIGGEPEPVRQSVDSLNETYYIDCLQIHIESIESCLDAGLELPEHYGVEFDLANLMRMDTEARYKAKGQAVKDGWLAPNEVRASEGYGPVAGGETPYLQMQNYSLAALAKRDAKDDPFGTKTTAPTAAPQTPPQQDAGAKELCDAFIKQCMLETAQLGDNP